MTLGKLIALIFVLGTSLTCWSSSLEGCSTLLYEVLGHPRVSIFGPDDFDRHMVKLLAEHLKSKALVSPGQKVEGYIGAFADQPHLMGLAGRQSVASRPLGEALELLFTEIENGSYPRLKKLYRALLPQPALDLDQTIFICMLNFECKIQNASWLTLSPSTFRSNPWKPDLSPVTAAGASALSTSRTLLIPSVAVLASSHEVKNSLEWLFYSFGVVSRALTMRELGAWVDRNIHLLADGYRADAFFHEVSRLNEGTIQIDPGFVEFMTDVGRSKIDVELGQAISKASNGAIPPIPEHEAFFGAQKEAFSDVSIHPNGARFMKDRGIYSGNIYEFERNFYEIVTGSAAE